ncbi:hypothetical protein AWC38_SpisGene17666 [Stylophora pistillata]|uniref:SAP domain-containing protein n=1 Tax=Stylophora pistillata TaxID=50429 RepID=A0A2B4RMD6_STYPI|nr:hypothetical protein AWC38_SpisGene17666 [Stylophora pistillata]
MADNCASTAEEIVSEMSLSLVKAELQRRGLPAKGKKPALMARLIVAIKQEESNPPSLQNESEESTHIGSKQALPADYVPAASTSQLSSSQSANHQLSNFQLLRRKEMILKMDINAVIQVILETSKSPSNNIIRMENRVQKLNGYMESCSKKLMRQTTALELVNWADQHEKGRAAEILVMEAMSSEERCYEDQDANTSKVTKYSVHHLQWESVIKQIKSQLKVKPTAFRGSRPVNDYPQCHVFESQVEEEHQSTVATDGATDGVSCEEPDPSEENQTTTKQRKASKRPLRKKPRLADALQQSNEHMEQLRETISQNVITPETRSTERREDREFFREMFGMMGMTQMLTQVQGGTGNQKLPLFHSFPPQATQYPLHPIPQHAVQHCSPYYSDRHTPPLSSSRCCLRYTDRETPTLPDL